MAAWRTRKVEQIRRAVRDTTEAMCSVVATTGKLTWPVELEGGRRETYEVDYGELLSYSPATKLTAASRLPDMYKLLRGMELAVKQAGMGGNIEFWAGSDVVSVLLGIVEGYTATTKASLIGFNLNRAVSRWGITRFASWMKPTRNPNDEMEWLPKQDPQNLVGRGDESARRGLVLRH